MKRLLALLTLLGATSALGQVFNCLSSAFVTTNTSCGVGGLIAGSGAAFKVIGTTNGATPAVSSGNVQLSQTNISHFALSLAYQTTVNVQAFNTTFTFLADGQNIALTFNNCANNGSTGTGTCGGFAQANFSSGAACEGGFYQGYSTANPAPYNIFALMFDQYAPLTGGGGFLYSSVQLYQQNQSPCIPAQGGEQEPYWSTTKFSTSPVPLNSPATSQGTTTGDNYSANVVYDGSTITLNLCDITVNGSSCQSSCPTNCFVQTWSNVNIPGQVNGTTAYAVITASGGTSPTNAGPATVTGWEYTVNTATASPGSTATSGGSSTASNPTFSPVAGTYTGTQNVTITCPTTSNSSPYYNTAASFPAGSILPIGNNIGGVGAGTAYTTPVTISSTTTLAASCAVNNNLNVGFLPSGVVQGVFTINAGTAGTSISGGVKISGGVVIQ